MDAISGGTPGNLANLVLSAGSPVSLAPDLYGGLTPSTLEKNLMHREYIALLSLTLDSQAYYWASDDIYYDSQWYEAKLTDWPQPSDEFSTEYQILTQDSFNITLNDADLSLATFDDDWLGTAVTILLVTRRHYDDGTTDEAISRRSMQIDRWDRAPGQITLGLVDLTDRLLEKTYPTYTYTVDTATPDIFEEDVGIPIPDIVGYGLKLSAVLVDNNDEGGPWIYGVCLKPSGQTMTVLAVYRGEGALIDAAEYTQGTLDCGDYDIVTLSFAAAQVDFNSQPYLIQVDVQNETRSQNAATELSRIMTWAGLTVDATSLAAAETVATANDMTVSYGYGRDRSPISVRTIIDNLLLLLRGQLIRNDSSEYDIEQDVASSIAATYVENQGDLIQVDRYSREAPPATVKVAYRPHIVDPSTFQHTLSRSVTDGIQGERQFDLDMVRDFATADRFACYHALREQYNHRASATVHNVQHIIGELIAIDGTVLWSGSKTWMIIGITREADANQLELLEYNAAVYNYAAGTEPSDGSGYYPDYSNTVPDAPTALTKVSDGIVTAVSGDERAWAKWKCTPPAQNWEKIYLAISYDATGQIQIQQGKDDGTGKYVANFGDLIPGGDYTVVAWAENSYGMSGYGVTDKYVTADYTAAADATAPNTPASITVTQGTGRAFAVSWPAVTNNDLKEYVLERKAGAGAYAEVYRGIATAKTDTYGTLTYGTAYYYRVKAVDYSGNSGSYCTAAVSATLTQIQGEDEVDNISATSITTGSLSCDRLSGGTLSGQTISGGTITGAKVRTSSGTTRVELSDSGNQLAVIESGNTYANLGYTTVSGSDWVILDCGTSGFTRYAARFQNSSLTLSTVTVTNHNSSYGTALSIGKGNVDIADGTLKFGGSGNCALSYSDSNTLKVAKDIDIADGKLTFSSSSNCALSAYDDNIMLVSNHLAVTGYIYLGTDSVTFQYNDANDDVYLYLLNSGTSTQNALFIKDYDDNWAGLSVGDVYYETAQVHSDKKLKKEVKPLAIEALPLIERLQPSNFKWLRDKDKTRFGLIAQDVQAVIPDLVSITKSGTLAYDVGAIQTVLIKAVQELSAKVSALENR